MGETSIVPGPSATNVDLKGRSALVTGAASEPAPSGSG